MSKEKPHVAIVINDFTVGGAQKLIVDQLRHFDDRCTYSLVTLFSFPEKSDFYSDIPEGISLYTLSFRNFFDLKSWMQLLKLFREIRPDVVISHLFFANTVTRVLRILCGYACIAVEHNTYIHKTGLQVFVDTVLSFVTFRIVAVSETVATFTAKQEHISPKKFVVIHNGIDIKKIQEQAVVLPEKEVLKKGLGFTDEEKVIVNVGRLTPQKNQLLLLDGFADFVKKHPEYRLVILGEGGYRSKLEKRIADLDLSEVVSLPGYKDPIPYYVAGDFLALTSEIEGFAIVGIEAMACGMPMVSTKTAGPDEYLREGENGFFIRENKVSEAFEKMVGVGDSFSIACRDTATAFDIRTNAEKHTELFLETTRK
ncbi:glycosyltransferase [Candidatus Kaiserbacteria bacterium]|nr:glycosyltransferase [Candidatus Kaiserbacteria bacterium]